ncbi:MAG: T9SS type A sorting domain-containing protein [Planctomycetales bacterium]|nr:T9SS type A sorting domain-containing protein [Planctomycetales bacterium]
MKLVYPPTTIAQAIWAFAFLLIGAVSLKAQPTITCPPDMTLDCGQPVPPPDPGAVLFEGCGDSCPPVDCCDDQPITMADGCSVNLDDCMQLALVCITIDDSGNPVYKVKLYNNCQQDLSNITFDLPAGVTGTLPANGATYTSCGFTFDVETPNGGPDAGTLKFDGTVSSGSSTCFEFTLIGGDIPDNLVVGPKYGTNNPTLLLPTAGCVATGGGGTVVHVGDVSMGDACSGQLIRRKYRVICDDGSTATCKQMFTIPADEQKPTVTFDPPNKTLVCGDPIAFDLPQAIDNCSAVTITTVGPDKWCDVSDPDYCWVIVRRWSIRDDCFNYAQNVEQRIYVPSDCTPCPLPPPQMTEFYTIPTIDDEPLRIEAGDQLLNGLEFLDLAVRPNPATSHIELSFTGTDLGEVDIEIFDLSGKRLYQNQLPAQADPVIQLNAADLGLQKGIYFVSARSNGHSVVKKLVIL